MPTKQNTARVSGQNFKYGSNMISEEELTTWEGLAQFRIDRQLSIDPVLVIELIAEVRRLQKLLHAVSDTSNALLKSTNQLEKEADWLAELLGKSDCPKNPTKCDILKSGKMSHNDCAKCWREVARKATRNEE